MKEKRYWLRGGILASVLFGSIFTILVLFVGNSFDLRYKPGYEPTHHFIRSILFVTFFGFIIGVLFGWIYGKIKNRNK